MIFKKHFEKRRGIFVTKPSLPPAEEYMEYVRRIFDNGILTNMGPMHEEFREKLSDYLDADICIPTCNGHMALEMTIQAMGLKGEVITTPFTFASTTHAIVRNGCTPVFCDIREEDCTMDAEKIEELITDKTVAIVPVHVYGLPCNVDRIAEIAKKHNLKVIYDAAHAFGVKVGRKSISQFGDASMISFHATKAFQTIEGGCTVVHDKDLAMRIYHLINFGIMSEETVASVGANAKMNEFEAAMGICSLNHFEEYVASRKEIFETYRRELSEIPGIRLPQPYRQDVTMNYAYMPLFFDPKVLGKDRDKIYNYLALHKVYARKYFYPLTSSFECYRDKGFSGYVPVAEKASKEVLTLPIYSDLTVEEAAHICDLIRKCI
ncbi:MAG: DegT/DnrJ/EryC1/StrS family aminotransferase [Lachnospiraceae bacterium]|nr:DegT/DnrJ/EryC1/StrS family aminotransferase [Lachnospiraceae bacterium]